MPSIQYALFGLWLAYPGVIQKINQRIGEEGMMRSRLVLLVLLLALPLTVVAAPRNAGKVTFTEPVTVGTTVLNAGAYKVKWDGAGSAVQVSFLQGNKTVATVPATVAEEANPFDGAIEAREQKDNARVLEKIMWRDVSLTFNPAALAQGK